MEENKDVIIYDGKELELMGGESGFLARTTKPKKLETKVIKYESIGDPLEISSMSHIVFPFFTSRVKNRSVNLEYHFKDMGIKFFSAINSDESLNIKQPGTFEEKIYNFILQKSFEVYEEEKEKLKDRKLDADTEEEVLKGVLSSLEFTFDLPEVLEFMELKKNPVYYKKVEEALANMKYTNYRFEKTNNSKSNKTFFEFESLNFSLINYERVKNGRKNYYKVHPSNFLLEKTLKNKQYLYFTKESRKTIGDVSSAALRIYKYISMKRFNNSSGVVGVETLAIIIPYELYSMNTSNGKQYKKNKINEVTKKIVKNFESLKGNGYIKDYREVVNEKGQPAIKYSFTEKLGLVTEYTKPKETKKIEISAEKKGDKELPISFGDDIKTSIAKVKRNIFVSKSWNKRVDNKIANIVKDQGEEYAIYILKQVYENLKQDVRTTLVQYMNGIMKNVSKDEFLEENPKKKTKEKLRKVSKKIEVVEAEIVEEPVKGSETLDPMVELLYKSFENYKQKEKERIEEQARENYLTKTGSKAFNSIHEKIFSSLKKIYVVDVMKKELG